MLIGDVFFAGSVLCFDSTGLKWAPNHFSRVSSVTRTAAFSISSSSLMRLIQMPLERLSFQREADILINAVSLLEVPESLLTPILPNCIKYSSERGQKKGPWAFIQKTKCSSCLKHPQFVKIPRKRECQINTKPVNNAGRNSLCCRNHFSEGQAEHTRAATRNRQTGPKEEH